MIITTDCITTDEREGKGDKLDLPVQICKELLETCDPTDLLVKLEY